MLILVALYAPWKIVSICVVRSISLTNSVYERWYFALVKVTRWHVRADVDVGELPVFAAKGKPKATVVSWQVHREYLSPTPPSCT